MTTTIKRGLFTVTKKQVRNRINYDDVSHGYFDNIHTIETIYKFNRITGKKKIISTRTIKSELHAHCHN